MTEFPRELPLLERDQPDPQLSLSEGRASPMQIALTALGCVFILGLMIYGLNRPMTEPGQVASAPPARETTGAAPQEPQAQPPAQAQPEPVKPAQPDDSQRSPSPAQ